MRSKNSNETVLHLRTLNRILPILVMAVAASCCPNNRVDSKGREETIARLLDVRFASTEHSQTHSIRIVDSAQNVYFISRTSLITEDDVVQASKIDSNTGEPGLLLILTEAAQRRLTELTPMFVGKHLAIVVRGEVVSVPRVMDPIKQLIVLRHNPPYSPEQVDELIAAFHLIQSDRKER